MNGEPSSRGVWTIVVAAGSGQRFGAAKQNALLGGQRVLDRAVCTAREVSQAVVVVVRPQDLVAGQVAGGATRSESVRNGLAAVPASAEVICVHDAARPLASAALYGAVVDAVRGGADGAVPGVPVTDTIKLVDEHGVVLDTLRRDALVAVQTPQAFRAGALRAAHAADAEATDDAALVESTGGRVVVVPGEATNRKITSPDDLAWAERQLVSGRDPDGPVAT
jgi:2-C-methyl-D-erythritol 4-phosphate cytidylyltransferase